VKVKPEGITLQFIQITAPYALVELLEQITPTEQGYAVQAVFSHGQGFLFKQDLGGFRHKTQAQGKKVFPEH
jgi:hypothetical protein